MHHRLRNYIGRTLWYPLVKSLKWNLGSVCLEILLILMQDRCTGCMEHTICSEINLHKLDGTVDALDGTNRLVSVQDSCVGCAQCTIGSEIVVEVPDGTPR